MAAPQSLEAGLVQAVFEGDFLVAAVAFAHVAAKRGERPRLRDQPVALPAGLCAEDFFFAARAEVLKISRGQPAPLKCVDAVRAAVELPFDQGLTLEWRAFLELVQTVESQSLRHAFLAERAAGKAIGLPSNTPTRPIVHAAVVGLGTMGSGIAMRFANAGIPVTVFERDQSALARGMATCRGNWEASARKGKLSMVDVEQRCALLKPTLDFEDLAQADIVIEAVFEDLAIKRGVLRELDTVMKPRAILATNTSTLDVDQIASATQRPQDVIGLHFFSPANVMRLFEVVRAKQTSDEVLATVMQLGRG